MNICHGSQLNSAGIGHYQFCPILFCPEDPCGHKGMGRGGIGTDHKDAVGIFQFSNGVSHGSTPKGCGKTCHGGGVSEPGAVIHVVGSHCGPRKFLEEVIFLIGNLCRC